MHRDGDRLLIEPVRKRVSALLKSMEPLGEDFPEIEDRVPDIAASRDGRQDRPQRLDP